MIAILEEERQGLTECYSSLLLCAKQHWTSDPNAGDTGVVVVLLLLLFDTQAGENSER